MSLKRWNGTAWVVVAGSRPGAQGPQGLPGAAATISVGTVTTLPSGSAPTVLNSGTSSAAVLNFSLPTGTQGPAGAAGNGRTKRFIQLHWNCRSNSTKPSE